MQNFLFGSEGNLLKTIENDKIVLIFWVGFDLRNFKTNLEFLLCFSLVGNDQFVSFVDHIEISPRANANNSLEYLNVALHYNNFY